MTAALQTDWPRPAAHLRGGKLCRADQDQRDSEIADRYRRGQTIGEISDQFLIGYVTAWMAVRRKGARISMREVALRREDRRRQRTLGSAV